MEWKIICSTPPNSLLCSLINLIFAGDTEVILLFRWGKSPYGSWNQGVEIINHMKPHFFVSMPGPCSHGYQYCWFLLHLQITSRSTRSIFKYAAFLWSWLAHISISSKRSTYPSKDSGKPKKTHSQLLLYLLVISSVACWKMSHL